MGQSPSHPFSNGPEIARLIENDQWQVILQQRQAAEIIDIDLNCDTIANPFKHKYIMKLDYAIPPNCIMTLIFPNHPVEKMRLLWTSGSLEELSRQINARIKESSRDGVQLVVTSSDKFYRFANIIGTVYLVWAERINQQTLNNQENTIAESIPVLFELNGQFGYRNIFVFGNDKLTKLQDCEVLYPFQYPIFCCETDRRKEQLYVVSTLSNSQADQITLDPAVRTQRLDQLPLPFSNTTTDEELTLVPTTGRFTNYEIKDPEKLDEGCSEDVPL